MLHRIPMIVMVAWAGLGTGLPREAVAADRIALSASEPPESKRTVEDWPAIVGVALPKGVLKDPARARVVDADGPPRVRREVGRVTRYVFPNTRHTRSL